MGAYGADTMKPSRFWSNHMSAQELQLAEASKQASKIIKLACTCACVCTCVRIGARQVRVVRVCACVRLRMYSHARVQGSGRQAHTGRQAPDPNL